MREISKPVLGVERQFLLKIRLELAMKEEGLELLPGLNGEAASDYAPEIRRLYEDRDGRSNEWLDQWLDGVHTFPGSTTWLLRNQDEQVVGHHVTFPYRRENFGPAYPEPEYFVPIGHAIEKVIGERAVGWGVPPQNAIYIESTRIDDEFQNRGLASGLYAVAAPHHDAAYNHEGVMCFSRISQAPHKDAARRNAERTGCIPMEPLLLPHRPVESALWVGVIEPVFDGPPAP